LKIAIAGYSVTTSWFLILFPGIYTCTRSYKFYREMAPYTHACATITVEWRGRKPIKWKLHPPFTCLQLQPSWLLAISAIPR